MHTTTVNGMLIVCIFISRKVNDEKMTTYKDFCKSLDNKDLESCLVSDLKVFCRSYLYFWHNCRRRICKFSLSLCFKL